MYPQTIDKWLTLSIDEIKPLPEYDTQQIYIKIHVRHASLLRRDLTETLAKTLARQYVEHHIRLGHLEDGCPIAYRWKWPRGMEP